MNTTLPYQPQIDTSEPVSAESLAEVPVLPPESPLSMHKQELLPTPMVLQRTFWRKRTDQVLGLIVMPVRLSRAVYTFVFAAEEEHVVGQ